jgi:hypothetical protein
MRIVLHARLSYSGVCMGITADPTILLHLVESANLFTREIAYIRRDKNRHWYTTIMVSCAWTLHG